ncbi:MAG: hypothetical protein NVSMB65_03500 [Chloroflexota bacterium]
MTTETAPGARDRVRRLFFAVMVPEAQRRAVLHATRHLEEVRRHVRWARPEGLHVTLRFLGDCTDERAEAALAAGAEAAAAPVMEVVLEGLGVFPSLTRPRVVWVGMTAGGLELVALHGRLEHALLRRGVVRDREHFTPHLTLGRVRAAAGAADRQAVGRAVAAAPRDVYGRFPATQLELVESVLGREGARYTTVASLPLARRDAPPAERLE